MESWVRGQCVARNILFPTARSVLLLAALFLTACSVSQQIQGSIGRLPASEGALAPTGLSVVSGAQSTATNTGSKVTVAIGQPFQGISQQTSGGYQITFSLQGSAK